MNKHSMSSLPFIVNGWLGMLANTEVYFTLKMASYLNFNNEKN